MPPALDPEFLHDYERERLRWLRLRFLWLTGGLGGVWLLIGMLLGLLLLSGVRRPEHVGGAIATAALLKAALFLVPGFMALRAKEPPSRDRILRLVFWMILGYTLVQILSATSVSRLISRNLAASGVNASVGPVFVLLFQTLLVHLVTSICIPWTPREAIRPLIPFLAIFLLLIVVGVAIGDSDVVMGFICIALMIAMPAPGLAICALRQSRFARRFEDRAVRARYGQLRHELSTARRIHDRLFPLPIATGPIHADFVYEPMHQIGGDLLFVHTSPAGDDVNAVLLDVTGHGIAAALAVNRLHGELARIYGSEPDPSPGKVLAALNRYIHLTMSRDTVFATAVCLRVLAARDEVVWANAGHPPALLRPATGEAAWLDCTTFLLGASDPNAFDSSELRRPFHRGDAVLAYSDGAIEARLRTGGQLGLSGLRAIADNGHASKPGWCGAILQEVTRRRDGPAQDDMLLVRIARPLA